MSKRVTTIHTVSLLIISIFSGIQILDVNGKDGSFGSGSGTLADPFIIEDVWGLQNMSLDLTAYYALGNNIDASATIDWNNGTGFEPVGNISNGFAGCLDGRFFVISDLIINRPAEDHIGLFGHINKTGIIANVNLHNVSIRGKGCAGGLVGANDGQILNCSVSGTIIGGSFIGGLIGWNKGFVSNCKAYCRVSGNESIGGLAGLNFNSAGLNFNSIINSSSFSNVSGIECVGGLIGSNSGIVNVCKTYCRVSGNESIGGLVGFNHRSIINCSSFSNVSGIEYVGGIAGNQEGREICDSDAQGKVIGSQYVGGIAGGSLFYEIMNSSFHGTVFGENNIGGILGWGFEGHVSNSQASGEVFGNYSVGGLVGYLYVDDHVADSCFVGMVKGNSSIGGLVGRNGGYLKNSHAMADVFGNNSVGGLSGVNGGRITDSYVVGNITGYDEVGGISGVQRGGPIESSFSSAIVKGTYSVGGAVGKMFYPCRLISSFTSGKTIGHSMVGGLIGNNSGCIFNSYTTADVEGKFFVGGSVGVNNKLSEISSIYSNGQVKGEGYIGGLVGWNTGSVSRSFWDLNSSGILTSPSGRGKTTTEMMMKQTFIKASWDFKDIWGIVDGVTYPLLKWQDKTPPIAIAGPDRIEEAGYWIIFNGGGSLDNIGISNFTWTFSGPKENIVLYGVSPVHSFSVLGKYVVTLNVTDPGGFWDEDTLNMTICDNTRPVADAGEDQIVHEGTMVIFDGRGSFDNLGILNWSWTFSDEDPVILYKVRPTYLFNDPGLFVVVLNVTDSVGYWHTDSMTVTVMDDTSPLAIAGPDQIVIEDTLVSFDGSGSYDNVGIVNWTWTFNDIGQIILMGIRPNYVFGNPGVFAVILKVTDDAGHWHTDMINVTVMDKTSPIAYVGSDKFVIEDTVVGLDGEGCSDNVGIIKWTWTFKDGDTDVILFGATSEYIFTMPGIYNITLTVLDEAGNEASTFFLVTVKDVTRPVVNAGPDKTIWIGRGTTITLNGTASDNVGIVNWTWSFNDGKGSVTLYGDTTQHNFSVVGDYLVTLTVMDKAGNTAADTMIVHVNIPDTDGDMDEPDDRSILDYWWIAIIILVVLILICIGFFMSKKKNKKIEE